MTRRRKSGIHPVAWILIVILVLIGINVLTIHYLGINIFREVLEFFEWLTQLGGNG